MAKKFVATVDNQETPFEIEEKEKDQLKVAAGSKEWLLDVHQAGPHHYSVVHEGKSYDLRFFHEKNSVSAFLQGEHLYFQLEDAGKKSARGVGAGLKPARTTAAEGPVEIRAMMPGKIVKVEVKKGDSVSEGQGVVVVEAMKMENEMLSPKKGTVSDVRVVEGQSVESGTVMVIIE